MTVNKNHHLIEAEISRCSHIIILFIFYVFFVSLDNILSYRFMSNDLIKMCKM